MIEADAESSAKVRKSHAFIADELPITAGRFTTRGRNSKRQYQPCYPQPYQPLAI